MLNTLIAEVKVDKTTTILQFLPDKLSELTKSQFVIFNNQKLKTAYLIDIVHSLLLKYFFRRENEFSLSSVILKKNYGKFYNIYIQFLLNQEIILLKKDYSAGNKSRQYVLSDSIINDNIKRYVNSDKIIIKKRQRKKDLNGNNKINPLLKVRILNSLDRVTLDYEKSISFLMSIAMDKATLNRNLYALDCIKNNYIFWQFDDYGRFHSNFTILKSLIRKNCLLLNGEETVEIDIPNSQPLFLLKLIYDEGAVCKPAEINLFRKLVLNGELYAFMQNHSVNKSREEIKKAIYHVLFGNNKRSSADILFKKIFPTIYNFIIAFKKQNKDYKSLSHRLQHDESQFIYNNVLVEFTRLYPKIDFLSVHDSIIVPKSYRNECRAIFDTCFKKHFLA